MKNIELTNSKEIELHNCNSQNFDNVGEPEPMSEILLTKFSNMLTLLQYAIGFMTL